VSNRIAASDLLEIVKRNGDFRKKLWKNHRCISLTSLHKRGCRPTAFLERLIVRPPPLVWVGCRGTASFSSYSAQGERDWSISQLDPDT
jgi:hypothetical protein